MALFSSQPDDAAGIDVELSEHAPTSNRNGGIGICQIGTAVNKTPANHRFLLSFNLTSIPAGAYIVDGSLWFKNALQENIQVGDTFTANRVTRSNWGETTATWNKYDGTNNWTTPGGDFTATNNSTYTVAVETDDIVFVSLKALIDDAIANRAGILHLLIRGPEGAGAARNIIVNTSAWATAAERPKLDVTYVPRGSDTLSVSLVESGSLGPTDLMSSSDTLALAAGEAVAGMKAAFTRTDAPAVSFSESRLIVSSLARSDATSVSLSEAKTLASALQRVDTINANLLEFASFAQAITLSRADTLAAGVSESRVIVVSLSRTDTPTAGITESRAIASALSRVDAITASLAEAVALANRFASGDALYVSAAESRGLAGTMTRSDTASLSLGESTATTAGLARTDSASVSFSESKTLAAMLGRSDALAVSVAEASVSGVTWYIPGVLYVLPANRLHYTI